MSETGTGGSALILDHVTRSFGGLLAVDDISTSVCKGEIRGVIGPNGAGKTTLFNLISGFDSPTRGQIHCLGKPIVGKPPHTIVALGITRTFQNLQLFRNLTLLENVMLGTHTKLKSDVLEALVPLRRTREEEKWGRDEALSKLQLVGLADQAYSTAINLSYGHQKLLEIARALASEPSMLLLDEPAAGLNPSDRQVLKRVIQTVNTQGVTILLVEHDMNFVMDLCHKVTVLDYGRKIAEGPPEQIRRDELVIQAYLGTGEYSRANPRER